MSWSSRAIRSRSTAAAVRACSSSRAACASSSVDRTPSRRTAIPAAQAIPTSTRMNTTSSPTRRPAASAPASATAHPAAARRPSRACTATEYGAISIATSWAIGSGGSAGAALSANPADTSVTDASGRVDRHASGIVISASETAPTVSRSPTSATHQTASTAASAASSPLGAGIPRMGPP